MINTFLKTNQSTLNKLTDFMLSYNQKVNLTRITEPDEITLKHYIDSILPLTLYDVPRGTFALDVGSGAGFPGIPMKLFRPDLDVTLLDSSRKRTDYLKAALAEIGVPCRVETARSEDLSHNPDFRGKFGLVTARAVANLAALCEYCLPFAEMGGVFLAMKGDLDGKGDKGEAVGRGEVAAARNACGLLGGEIECVKEYALPSPTGTGAEHKRNLVVIRKVRQTPTAYPRKRVNITKNPL